MAEVEKAEREIAVAVERVLGTTPAETWGWSKDQMPVVYHGEKGRTLSTMRWGVWPFYEKSLPGRPVVNARDDALLVKNIWKHSARTKRCVAAADGFFEWTGPQGAKWEVRFSLPEEHPFFFGAIWSNDPVGGDRGFAIVTTQPNPVVAEIGHDRTPLILDAEGAKRWIGSEPLADEQLLAFCQPYAGQFVRRDMAPPEKKKKLIILTAIIDCGSKLTELCKFCIRFRPARKLLFDRFRDQGQSWEVGVVETVSPCSFPDALNRV